VEAVKDWDAAVLTHSDTDEEIIMPHVHSLMKINVK
jgi:hypothetical protein